MSTQEADVIRARVLEIIQESQPGRCRYPRDLKEAAIEYARRRRSEGATVKEICDELGLRHWTLHKWLRSVRDRFLPVKVRTAAEQPLTVSPAPALTTPRGYRVDGLRVEEVLFLLHHLDR